MINVSDYPDVLSHASIFADVPVFIEAEKAEQPPKPVRKANRLRSTIPKDPSPFSYAEQVRIKFRKSLSI